jgi:uncharacterized protein (TIGR02145 family)
MNHIARILSVIALSGLLLTCDKEESKFGRFTDTRDNTTYPTVNVDGTVWMMENLRYGTSLYSYQYALYACPAGWSLPTSADWIKLCNHYGGYLNFSTPEGDPFQAYSSLTSDKTFNADAGVSYWTSTPAWEDGPQIKSYVVQFESIEKQVIHRSGFVTNQRYCRCIKKEKQDGDDLLQFTRNGNFYKFDYYRIDSELTAHENMLAIMIHKELNNQFLDRCLFTLELPSVFVTPGSPVVTTNATLNHMTLDITFGEYSFHNLSAPAFFSVTITQYDGQTVDGTFTGQTSDLIQVTDGEFHFKIKSD